MNQQNQLSQARGFGKLLWNPDTLQHHSFRHLTSAQFQAPLSKARGLAEILKKNYIIITLATLRRASRLRFCVLASHNRRPLCPSERDPYHTDHCKDQHKGRGERYFITRVLARSVSFVGFCQPPFYAAGKKKFFQPVASEFGRNPPRPGWMYIEANTDICTPTPCLNTQRKRKALVSICRAFNDTHRCQPEFNSLGQRLLIYTSALWLC